MFQLLANATAERLLSVIVAVMAVMWIGGRLAGSTPTNGEYLTLAGFLVALALVDHLHGIRQALEQRRT